MILSWLYGTEISLREPEGQQPHAKNQPFWRCIVSIEQNKSIVYRWVEEAWNQGNFSMAKELYPATYQLRDDTLPAPVNGPDGLVEFIKTFRRGMPDIHLTVEQAVGEGDLVAWRFRATGTQTQEMLGIPATHRKVAISGMILSRFEQGRWVEDYSNWDIFTMLRQLGAIPQPSK
jgi:steroid delta-isomerase-like uncharacterized protein